MSLNKQCNRKVAELKASLISYVPKKRRRKELKASSIGSCKKIVPEEKSVSLPEVEAVPEKKLKKACLQERINQVLAPKVHEIPLFDYTSIEFISNSNKHTQQYILRH